MLSSYGPIVSMVKHRTPNARFEVRVLVGPPNMVRHLNHRDWVKQQFENKYLKTSYRNVLIHSSIIEGTIRNLGKKDKFVSANKFLLTSGKITSNEFCIFNDIRNIRNSLVHDSFKNGLNQDEIDRLRDSLMEKIHLAYRKSNFLDKKLLKKYAVPRLNTIKFDINE